MRAQTIVSAGIIVYLNAKPYGRVKDFAFESVTGKKAQYGLDSLEPYELIPTSTKVTGHMTIVRTIGDAGAEGAAITARFEDLPRERYFTIQLVERVSDTLLFEARYCSVTRQAWNVPEKGMVTGTVEFEALDWSNELRSSEG